MLSNQSLGTTFHISISLDDSGDLGITVNGTTITSAALGRIGNGPFRVILGQRESDDESPGNPPPAPDGAERGRLVQRQPDDELLLGQLILDRLRARLRERQRI